MSLAIVGAGVGIATGAYSVYSSIRKNAKANKLARENVRPVFNAAGEIQEVYDLATNEINNNYLQDYATSQSEQGQAAGIDAILKSGGRADFGVIQNQFGQQLKNNIAMLARERSSKIAAQANAAYAVGRAESSEFQYNEDAPYKDQAQWSAELAYQSAQERSQGISTIASGAASLGTALMKPGDYESKEVARMDRETRKSINAMAGAQRTNGVTENYTPGLVNPNATISGGSGPNINTRVNEFGQLVYG